ncbi:hypothetical protein MWMV10_MWMV10_01616 [Acinetobacter baumannii]|nr:hypothetical protein MWMV10_MWMV10_01616 [Acinetobacter baumannii]CAI4207259.1 hypothetical protein MWMV15_MWMV15_01565 [Acinetobacter baumannii]
MREPHFHFWHSLLSKFLRLIWLFNFINAELSHIPFHISAIE